MKETKIALVTGANGGFGKEFVKLLLQERSLDEIWCVARSESKLDALRGELGEKIVPIPLDLTHRDSLNVIRDRLEGEKPDLRFLVNNAGFDKFGPYNAVDLDTSLNMIDLNVSAVVALGLTAIPYMGRGSHILNVASLASFLPLPYMDLYAATKVFVRHYTRALNVELKDKGVSATAVCPGWMKTGLFDRAETGADKTVRNFTGLTTPDRVARKALEDAKRGRDMSTCGAFTKVTHLASKLLPQQWAMKVWTLSQDIR